MTTLFYDSDTSKLLSKDGHLCTTCCKCVPSVLHAFSLYNGVQNLGALSGPGVGLGYAYWDIAWVYQYGWEISNETVRAVYPVFAPGVIGIDGTLIGLPASWSSSERNCSEHFYLRLWCKDQTSNFWFPPLGDCVRYVIDSFWMPQYPWTFNMYPYWGNGVAPSGGKWSVRGLSGDNNLTGKNWGEGEVNYDGMLIDLPAELEWLGEHAGEWTFITVEIKSWDLGRYLSLYEF